MGNQASREALILRLLCSLLGLCLLALMLWGSLWAGFKNFDVANAWGREDRLFALVYVLVNYALVAAAFWMLRGGPKIFREKK